MGDEASDPADRTAPRARVLGIVAVAAAVLPATSYLAWAVGIAAIAVAVIALRRPLSRRGPAVTGLVLGFLAVILSIVASVVYTLLVILAVLTPQLRHLPSGPPAPASSAADARTVLRLTGG